jgi:DNA-binding response OmpR family regulator
MPRLDGEETFRELRRRDPDVQVLLSSGYDEQEASARLSGDGLAGFLQKPYRASEVIARIASIVARHQAPVRETGPIPNG